MLRNRQHGRCLCSSRVAWIPCSGTDPPHDALCVRAPCKAAHAPNLPPAARPPCVCRYACVSYQVLDAFASSLPRAPGYPGAQTTTPLPRWCYPPASGKPAGTCWYHTVAADLATYAATSPEVSVVGTFLFQAIYVVNVCERDVTQECIQQSGIRACEQSSAAGGGLRTSRGQGGLAARGHASTSCSVRIACGLWQVQCRCAVRWRPPLVWGRYLCRWPLACGRRHRLACFWRPHGQRCPVENAALERRCTWPSSCLCAYLFTPVRCYLSRLVQGRSLFLRLRAAAASRPAGIDKVGYQLADEEDARDAAARAAAGSSRDSSRDKQRLLAIVLPCVLGGALQVDGCASSDWPKLHNAPFPPLMCHEAPLQRNGAACRGRAACPAGGAAAAAARRSSC